MFKLLAGVQSSLMFTTFSSSVRQTQYLLSVDSIFISQNPDPQNMVLQCLILSSLYYSYGPKRVTLTKSHCSTCNTFIFVLVYSCSFSDALLIFYRIFSFIQHCIAQPTHSNSVRTLGVDLATHLLVNVSVVTKLLIN